LQFERSFAESKMEQYYLFLVGILFVLAVSDLVVGVSNDAVNFLNSAIGSRVATRNVIMIVASAGILIGATFSSGMMEVARKGIFNPELFLFSDVMTIFLAVMITDIILLDLFNTFGLPTSTTVSIVFELLGASVAVSLIKILSGGSSLAEIVNYINSSSALTIITGIFLSVGIAFIVGALVQYVSRLLFTFSLHKATRITGVMWSGLALTALTYFLLIKGVKGASFITSGFIGWVQENTLMILGIGFVSLSLFMWVLQRLLTVNIFKVVVLFGTFSLAMAFAGNDLVNFIGVPIAGLESYNHFKASGVADNVLLMSFLNSPIRTDTYLLVAAGLIMIVTLWFSKKARSVTETEVNLGRQDEGDERFKANLLAKRIVRSALLISQQITHFIPDGWLKMANDRFKDLSGPEIKTADQPAFDLIRASVNLTVASILIAMATSFRLPLSTTYVSFMVAMGTSLADKAWGRNSAVFRVSGVLNVIGGWFFTAFTAFTAAALFAVSIYYLKVPAVIGLIVLAIVMISRTFLAHRRKVQKKNAEIAILAEEANIQLNEVIARTGDLVQQHLDMVRTIYIECISGLIQQDRTVLRSAGKKVDEMNEKNLLLKKKIYLFSKKLKNQNTQAGKLYLLIFDLQQDLIQSITLIVKTCQEHVENSLEPVNDGADTSLRELADLVDTYLQNVARLHNTKNSEEISQVLADKKETLKRIETDLERILLEIQNSRRGMRNSFLLFTIYLETKDIIAVAARFAKLYQRAQFDGLKSLYLLTSDRKP